MRFLVFLFLCFFSTPLYADQTAEGDHFICFDLIRYQHELKLAGQKLAEGNLKGFLEEYDSAGTSPDRFLIELQTEKITEGFFKLSKNDGRKISTFKSFSKNKFSVYEQQNTTGNKSLYSFFPDDTFGIDDGLLSAGTFKSLSLSDHESQVVYRCKSSLF